MRTQRGIGLVEMMVAITIGMLLVLGLGTVFVSVKQTSNLRQLLSVFQNNERMASMFLNTSIRNAGFYPNPLLPNPFLVSGSFTTAGQSIFGAGTGTAGTDTISVRFVAATSATASQGCSAQLVPGDLYTDVFSISGGYLTCTETDNTAASAPVTINLVAGLTGMNVVYGVDTTSSGSVTEYLPGDSVGSANWISNVRTAQITLLFNNPLAGQPGQAATVSLTQTIPYMIGL